MENIFKELFLSPSQGVSLSIADAKVDTFYKLTKHSKNFFVIIFKQKSQKADFQTELTKGTLDTVVRIATYMLQNIIFWASLEPMQKTQ